MRTTGGKKPGAEPGAAMFGDVNTHTILETVLPKLEDEVARSLWRRIHSEYASGGPGAVPSYLNARFAEIAARVRADVKTVQDAENG